jgi:hypothetical protein
MPAGLLRQSRTAEDWRKLGMKFLQQGGWAKNELSVDEKCHVLVLVLARGAIPRHHGADVREAWEVSMEQVPSEKMA